LSGGYAYVAILAPSAVRMKISAKFMKNTYDKVSPKEIINGVSQDMKTLAVKKQIPNITGNNPV